MSNALDSAIHNQVTEYTIRTLSVYKQIWSNPIRSDPITINSVEIFLRTIAHAEIYSKRKPNDEERTYSWEKKKMYAHTKWYKTETEIETNNLLWQVYRILLL